MSFTFACIIYDDISAADAFVVRIGKNKLVDELKEAIKEEIKSAFVNISARDLRLWKIEIPDDNEEELQNLTLQDSDQLMSSKEIKYYWSSPPPKDTINVIMFSKCYQCTLFENIK